MLLAARGDGHPVLVIPGLLAEDASTATMRLYLRTLGYDVHGWRQGRNYGLRPGVQDAMLDLIEELNDTHGRKVSLVGWSLGGLYARQLAKMVPARVRQVRNGVKRERRMVRPRPYLIRNTLVLRLRFRAWTRTR